jgi:hypothetical protein
MTAPLPTFPTLPKPVRIMVGAIAAALTLSALGTATLSFLVVDKPLWLLFGFEVVIAITGVLGLMFALGRFQEGQGLALACVAGTVAVASFLGIWFVLRRNALAVNMSVRPVEMLLLARLGAAGVLGLIGAWAVLKRNSRSWWYLGRAAMAVAPLLAAGAVFALGRAQVSSAASALPGWVSGLIGGILAMVGMVLVCAAVHCVIRAFEMGRGDERTT